MGPCADGNHYLVLIDYATGYPFMFRRRTFDSKDVAQILKDTWDQFGYPEGLVSDNGPQFVGKAVRDFLQEHDVHHYRTAVYNPTENGLVERWNRYLKGGMQTLPSVEDWDEGLKTLVPPPLVS